MKGRIGGEIVVDRCIISSTIKFLSNSISVPSIFSRVIFSSPPPGENFISD